MPKKPVYRKPPRPVTPAPPTESRGPRTNPDALAVDGKVLEALPNAMFTVELEGGQLRALVAKRLGEAVDLGVVLVGPVKVVHTH